MKLWITKWARARTYGGSIKGTAVVEVNPDEIENLGNGRIRIPVSAIVPYCGRNPWWVDRELRDTEWHKDEASAHAAVKAAIKRDINRAKRDLKRYAAEQAFFHVGLAYAETRAERRTRLAPARAARREEKRARKAAAE